MKSAYFNPEIVFDRIEEIEAWLRNFSESNPDMARVMRHALAELKEYPI